MLYVSAAENRYTAGEKDIILGSRKTWSKEQNVGIIFCHGSGADAESSISGMSDIFDALSPYATIHCGDLGYQTWGGDLVVERISEAMHLLKTEYGVAGKVALLGASMGSCSALNYALRYPHYISCVAALIPLTDLAKARANPYVAVRWPEIDAIYGAPPQTYEGHSPITFAQDIAPNMPIKIWASTNDPLVTPDMPVAFVNARPQTELTWVGAASHSVPKSATDDIVEFLATHHLAPFDYSTYPSHYPATY